MSFGMGYVENPTQAKSTTTVVVSSLSSSGGGGGGGGGKAHLEVRSEKPKFKRPRVKGVRRWPPNCGPEFRSLYQPGNNSVNKIESGGVTDCSGNGGLDLMKREEEEEEDVVVEEVSNGVAAAVVVDDGCIKLEEEKKVVVEVGNEGLVDQRGDDDAVEQGDGVNVKPSVAVVVVDRKYPPRGKVLGVRRFPPNCGRNANPLVVEGGKVDDETEEENRLLEKVRRDADRVRDVYVDGGGVESGRRFGSNVPERKGVKIEAKPKQFGGNGITRNPNSNGVAAQRWSSASEKMMSKGKMAPSSSNVRVDESYGRKEIVSREMKKPASLVKEDDWEDELDDADNGGGYELARRETGKSLSLTTSGPGTSTGLDKDRQKVKEVLDLFHFLCRKFLHDEGSKPKSGSARRVDVLASKELKSRGKVLNAGRHIIGAVPGVEIGDQFQYRLELNIIGLHRATQGGIDYTKHRQGTIATSVVASGGYDDNLDSSDVLEYTGQGGNAAKDKEPEDQKLQTGNLALKTSVEVKNPVRVIRGHNSTNFDARGRIYIYDGLYTVEKYWQERGPNGYLVFKFQLVRIPGQQELASKKWKNPIKNSSVRGFIRD